MRDVRASLYYKRNFPPRVNNNFTLRVNNNFPLPITNNIFAEINKSRLDKFENKHGEQFQRFFSEYFFARNKLDAQLWEKNKVGTEFWKVSYKGSDVETCYVRSKYARTYYARRKYTGTYYVSTEKVINALHFIGVRYEKGELQLGQLIGRFVAEVFYETNGSQKLTNEKWVENVRRHVGDMNSLLGTDLMDQILSSVLSPEISNIYHSRTSTFNPESQWKIEGIEILSDELFKIKKNLMNIGFHGKQHLQRIVASYIAKCDKKNDQSRFCHFISYVTTVVNNVKELDRQVLDLSFIASKENYFYPLLPQPPEDYQSPSPADPELLNAFGKVEKGFGNPIDFYWNVKCINDWMKKDKCCPAVLRECVENNDPSEQLRKLNALGERIFDQNAKKLTDSEHSPIFVDFNAGVVAVYKREAGKKAQYFLKMISKIADPEKVIARYLSVLFHPDRLVEDFVKREQAYEEAIEEEEKNSPSKYYIHRSDEHKNGSRNSDCWCWKNSFSEDDIRASVLRYLMDNPQMRNASAGAAHSIKHYKENAEEGQDWIDRLEMLRGVNLKHHIKQYLSTAKRLVAKLETETEKKWLERLRSKFTYSFRNSGVINIVFGIWSGGNDGIFAHLSITKDREMFIKTLFTGEPANEGQAKCFGLEKVWDRVKKSAPIEVDIKEGNGYVESDRRFK